MNESLPKHASLMILKSFLSPSILQAKAVYRYSQAPQMTNTCHSACNCGQKPRLFVKNDTVGLQYHLSSPQKIKAKPAKLHAALNIPHGLFLHQQNSKPIPPMIIGINETATKWLKTGLNKNISKSPYEQQVKNCQDMKFDLN